MDIRIPHFKKRSKIILLSFILILFFFIPVIAYAQQGTIVNPSRFVSEKLLKYMERLKELEVWYIEHCGKQPPEPIPPEEKQAKLVPGVPPGIALPPGVPPEMGYTPSGKWVPIDVALQRVIPQMGNNPFNPLNPLNTPYTKISPPPTPGGGGTGFVPYKIEGGGVASICSLQIFPTPQLISGSTANPELIWSRDINSPPGEIYGFPVGGAKWDNGTNMSRIFNFNVPYTVIVKYPYPGTAYTVNFTASSSGVTVHSLNY